MSRKPEWLTITPPTELHKFRRIKQVLQKNKLHTVCAESHCPNIPECWGKGGTATFLLMGDICTRACKFCNVRTALRGKPLDPHEPERLAGATAELGLKYVVLTSVDRDDLPDQGAQHLASCIRAIKAKSTKTIVEVLSPDFCGDKKCIRALVREKLDVFGHNVETVESLQEKVRDLRAGYEQSLGVLKAAKKFNPNILTKSSIMLGFGEDEGEVLKTMKDLRRADVDILTLGQYLQPSPANIPVAEYVTPEKFKRYREQASKLGFKFVASGPFVRSSYRAGELLIGGHA